MARATAGPIKAVQLAQLVDEAPEGPEWIHEQKFDGYRILADKQGKKVRLYSRRFNDWTAQFPTVVEAVAALPCERALLDGEVAAVMPDGRTSFQALQNAFSGGATNLAYFVFDLLRVDGEDLTALPLITRKTRLRELLGKKPRVLRYSDHVEGSGKKFFELACKQGLEGIVSKKRDSKYTGGRGGTWLKTKCLLRQEFVLAGFTDPEGARNHIGSLLVGYYDGKKLVYAGKVGTGFTQKLLVEMKALLDPLETTKCPFSFEPSRAWTGPGRHWCEPKLVGEVAFSEWTAEGRLRHPSFQGLRRDKRASEVVREKPTDRAE